MPTCSQCEVNRAQYRVDSSVLCQHCLTMLDRAYNVSRLKRSHAPRVDLKAMQFFRRRVAAGAFSGNFFPALPILAAAALAAPRSKRGSFFERFRGRLNHLARRIWSPASKG